MIRKCPLGNVKVICIGSDAGEWDDGMSPLGYLWEKEEAPIPRIK